CFLSVLSFLCSCYGPPRHLHSFPTRRSSDLPRQLVEKDGNLVVTTDLAPGSWGQADGASDLAVSHAHLHHLLLSCVMCAQAGAEDRKSTRLNSSHVKISYAVFCLKKKNPLSA